MLSEKMYQLGANRSCIRELFEYGLRQAAVIGKENVYDFSIGNPSIPAPAEVNRAFVSTIMERDALSVHGYTPAEGNHDARQAVARELSESSRFPIRAENIFFTCGAAPALIATIRALAVENCEIISIAPYFAEYKPFVENNGAKFVAVPADTERFQIRFDQLEQRITPHTQAVIINSPNNPSGVVYTEKTLAALGALLEEKSRELGHPIYIIADEPYRELLYDNTTLPFLPAIYPNTVICYSYSKSLSLPGERIGYVCVPDCAEDSERLFAAIAGAARTLGHVCAPSLQQLVIAQCTHLRPDLEAYDRNRSLLYKELSAYGYKCAKPVGAFYLFVRAPGDDAKSFSDRAKAYNLLVVPGNDFGCPEFFRISTCVPFDMIQKSLPIFKGLIEGSF